MEKVKIKKSSNDWRCLNYSVPITQTLTNNKNEFLIRGVAINETTTRNGHVFLGEELEAAVGSLRNKPILKDHTNTVDSIVGRTTNNVFFDALQKNISFEARIKDAKMQGLIKEGLITSVSVGAMVNDIEESDEGNAVLRGIDFVELSLVAVPADPNAGFSQAITASFEGFKKSQDVVVEDVNKDVFVESKKDDVVLEDVKMDDVKKEEFDRLCQENSEMKEQLKAIEEEKKIQEEVDKRVFEMKKKLEEEFKVKEESEEEESKEEPEDETKGEVSQDEEEKVEDKIDDFVIENKGKGFSLCLSNYDNYDRLSDKRI